MAKAVSGGPRSVSSVPQGSRASTQSGVPTDEQTAGEAPPAQGFAASPTEPKVPVPDDPAGDGSQSAAGNMMQAEEEKEDLTVIPGETKADKFQRLGKARTTRAIVAIRSLAKLATASYESTDEQRGKIFSTLRKELDAAEQSFKPKDKSGKPVFDL